MRYSFDLGKHSYDRKMFHTLSGRVKTQCVENLVESVKFGQSWSTKLVSGILFTQKLLNLKFKIVNLNSKSQEANSLNWSKWAMGFDILGVYFILWSIWFWFIFVHSRQITRSLNLILDIKMWRGMPFTKCGTWTNAISLWRSI